MFATMSDRASVNKGFNAKLAEYRKDQLGSETDLPFLFCNAHFLLRLSSACELELKKKMKNNSRLTSVMLSVETGLRSSNHLKVDQNLVLVGSFEQVVMFLDQEAMKKMAASTNV